MTRYDEQLRQVSQQLGAIRLQLAATNKPKPAPRISSEVIKDWMKSPSLDVRGAVFDFIMDPDRATTISPPLTFDDYRHFISTFLLRCITEDPRTEWALSRSRAGYELLRWFGIVWEDSSIDREILTELKSLLRTLCTAYDANVRGTVVQEVLEHLFENPSVRAFFDDWRSPELVDIYNEADDWQRNGGRSPFAPKGTR